MKQEIQIQELTSKQAYKLDKDLIDFNPVKCLLCGNKKNIVQRFFQLNVPVKSESAHKKVKKIPDGQIWHYLLRI